MKSREIENVQRKVLENASTCQCPSAPNSLTSGNAVRNLVCRAKVGNSFFILFCFVLNASTHTRAQAGNAICVH